jgi:uncharacterized membrane protein
MRVASIQTLMDRHKGLVAAIVTALAASALMSRDLSPAIRLALTWDVLAAVFLAIAWTSILRSGKQDIREQAARYNVNDFVVLLLCLLGVVASLIAIVGLVRSAAGLPYALKERRLALAVATVALSWFFLHTVLALHYAHSYFVPNDEKTGQQSGGLEFPGDDPPDYLDFLYFSFVLGATSQTSDVTITAKAIRRLVLLHGTVTFAFNTVLLALTVNVAASLF